MLFEETGCRPRLACLELISQSNAVIQYRLGRQLTWPVTSNVCADDMFLGDTTQLPLGFLVSRDTYTTSTVPCEIDAWFRLNGSDSDGQPLQGQIDACGSDVTFRYVTATSQETHRCLATLTERSTLAELTYIITTTDVSSTSGSTPRLFCWLLEKSVSLENPRLYLTYAADCHSETGSEIVYQQYTGYIAQFDLIAAETGQEWMRNCSSVPVVTTSETRPSTPSLTTEVASVFVTTENALVHHGSSSRAQLANAATAVVLVLIISLLHA